MKNQILHLIISNSTELALNEKVSLPFLYPQTIYKLTKMYRDELKAQKILDEFQRDIFAERRQLLKSGGLSNNNNEEKDEMKKSNIVIDHIILNENDFGADEIRDHFLTFVAGYETIANALAHAILLLAMHPEHQDRLYGEIQATVASDEDLKSSEHVNSLQYLELVLKETYRLMPTVPMLLRETLEDFEVEPGLVIPKNVYFLFNFYALHRRKDIWGDDADQFNPERFLPENSENRHQFTFLPFSAGQRICIANKYSNLCIKIAIIKLIQSFRLKTSMRMTDIRLKSYISLKLCTPHLLAVEKRRN